MVPPAGRPSLRVSLDIFDGPLDLLLHLVREQKVDIATVSLASVAQQYFDYLAVMEALDVGLAAEYLVIAATLVFLKSKSLLPPVPREFADEGEDSPEQVEERLRRRLIAYSKYKGIAEELRLRRAEAQAYVYREGGDPTSEFTQRYRIAPGKLVAALLGALRTAKPEKRTIAREPYTMARQMQFVIRAVRERDDVEFAALCRGLDRPAVIATFLAVLELIRQRRLFYAQPASHGTLHLLRFEPIHVYAN